MEEGGRRDGGRDEEGKNKIKKKLNWNLEKKFSERKTGFSKTGNHIY